MKTIAREEKKSLFSKLINKIKSFALVDMIFNPDSGVVISPDNVDTETQVKNLANSTGSSVNEIMSYEAAFNRARSNMGDLLDEVSKIPVEHKESINPFKVEESELHHSIPTKKKTENEKDQKHTKSAPGFEHEN